MNLTHMVLFGFFDGASTSTAAPAETHVPNWLNPSMSMWGWVVLFIGWIKWH